MTDSTPTGLRRRDLLATLTAAGGAGALAGCSLFGSNPDSTDTPTPEGTPTPTDTTDPAAVPHADEYETVVDLARAGADTTGAESIVPLLEEHVADDTLLYLPEGTYLMDEPWYLVDFADVGVVGPDAVIVPPERFAGTLFAVGDGRGFLFEGVTFDFTAERTGARPIGALVDDDLVVRDVTVRGAQDVDQDMMRFDVTTEEGTGLVERLRMRDGAAFDIPVTGCLVTGDSVGELTFRDCEIVGFPDNGLYASSATGRVRVEGGYYANNAISNVRVGDGAVISGAHVRVDYEEEVLENTRGIRLREGTDVLVENCTIELLRVPVSDGAITVSTGMREVTIRDTTIRVDANNVTGILAKSPSDRFEDGAATGVTAENVVVTGTAAGNDAIEIVDRDGSRLTGLCIHQTGDSRDGVRLLRSADNRIEDATIVVTGEALVLEDSTASTSGIRTGAATDDGGRLSAQDGTVPDGPCATEEQP